ncbi:hypothetical protein ACJRO7_023630 [Eucalyptus globulus]|uniref:Uncharacterized protein n=1 Tax=Eucalyptus globulus TaxID=34317 RepID=A0ABD3K4W2_EUCGL
MSRFIQDNAQILGALRRRNPDAAAWPKEADRIRSSQPSKAATPATASPSTPLDPNACGGPDRGVPYTDGDPTSSFSGEKRRGPEIPAPLRGRKIKRDRESQGRQDRCPPSFGSPLAAVEKYRFPTGFHDDAGGPSTPECRNHPVLLVSA